MIGTLLSKSFQFLANRLYIVAKSHAKIPANKLHATRPQTTPIGEIVQPLRDMSICIMFVVTFIIPPGIIQTNTEQISQTTPAVMAAANAKFKELIFIILTSAKPEGLKPHKLPINPASATRMPLNKHRICKPFLRSMLRQPRKSSRSLLASGSEFHRST